MVALATVSKRTAFSAVPLEMHVVLPLPELLLPL